MNTKNINLRFSLDKDNFSILENDEYCSIASIDFLHLGVNRNQCDISQECVEKSLDSFYNKPLLCILNNSVIPEFSTDFKEHAQSVDEENKMIALGTIPESSQFKFIERDNGKIYLNAKVVIWKNYFPVIMDILENRNGNVKVSIELAVINGEQDENTGILRIDEFRLLSCVLLGEDIPEGIEGSHLEIIRFALKDEEIKKANQSYLNFSCKNKEYLIPDFIKTNINNKLNKYKETGKGLSNTDLELAKYLANNKYIENKYVNKLSQLFSNSNKEIEKWINSIDISKGVNDILVNSLSNNELQEMVWSQLKGYTYKDGNWDGQKYYVEEIYSDEKCVIVRDNETAKYFEISYTIDNNNLVLDMATKKEVHRSYEEKKEFSAYTSTVFAKKEYGTGETIKVNKSKDSMSDSSWGSVNKTELRKKVLEAKNYKSLVKDVYALVEDGWEDAPSSKLKYPIMEIKDGEAVYNRYGLSSALAYAQKENETAVVNKVKSLYKKLDIDNEDKGGEKKMAKELDKDEEVMKNKVDKDNKDIEKIKDDADAQEDDVKEKEKKNACGDEIKNKIDKDDKDDEGLEDDVDSDKDYWKKQANALEIENSKMKEELKAYKRKDEEKEMACEIDKYAHCMADDEVMALKNSIKECSLPEMKEKIMQKVSDFALSFKEKEDKKEEIKYSFNPLFDLKSDKFSKKAKNLDDIIKE